jgi:NAD(P)-dependent dehydrogenase (short-subunit alcohol dehydrogenase family)
MSNLERKTCLVTGATSGIGQEIALGLWGMGANVVLVGRNRAKCESTLQQIKSSTNPAKAGNGISYLVGDLSSQASIRQLAKDYLSSHERLDVLVNNAGVFVANRTTTIDGIELTFAVNHLAPFLLTNLLLDRIRASSPSRIITTSSVAHMGAQIDFDDIQFNRRSYSGIGAYGQSKLANILFTKELARRLEGTDVTANCFHPGAVRTNLVKENSPWYYRLVWKLAGSFFLSPAKGADSAIYLASSADVKGVTGKYFAKRRQVQNGPQANNQEGARRLWSISEKLTGFEKN